MTQLIVRASVEASVGESAEEASVGPSEEQAYVGGVHVSLAQMWETEQFVQGAREGACWLESGAEEQVVHQAKAESC